MPVLLRVCIVLSIAAIGLGACSGDGDKEEAGAVDRLTSRVAHDAVQNIRQPMEQTRQQMQDIQDAHMKAVENALQEGR
jgi:hypothetical protein